MKKEQLSKLTAPIGLLIVMVTSYLSRRTTLPDFVTGLLMGIGLGLLIVSLIRQKRLRKQRMEAERF